MDTNVARHLNGEIRRIAETLVAPPEDDVSFGFVCECGCAATVMLTCAQFDRDGGAWLEGHRPH